MDESKGASGRQWLIGVIVVALIGLAGALGAALISARNQAVEISIQLEQLEAGATVQAVQVESIRESVEEPAATPIPTATSQPLPTSRPTAEPERVAAIVANLTECREFSIGETRNVPANTFIIGDVKIDGSPAYSNSENLGVIVYLEKESSIQAEWGAGCYSGTKASVNTIIDGQFDFGCGSKCSTVKVITVKSDGSQETDVFDQ